MCAGCIFILLVLPVELWVLWSSPTSPAGCLGGVGFLGGDLRANCGCICGVSSSKRRAKKFSPAPKVQSQVGGVSCVESHQWAVGLGPMLLTVMEGGRCGVPTMQEPNPPQGSRAQHPHKQGNGTHPQVCGGGMQLRLGLGSLGVSAKRGLSLWGIKEPFDGQGLRAVVMGPRSQSELSHGIQETELKRLKELFFRALLCFFSTCLSYEQRWYKRMAGTGPIALRLGVGRRPEEGEQGEGLSTAPDGMEMEGERRGQGCSAAAPGSAPPGE